MRWIIAAAVTLGVLATAVPASADWYYSQREAQKITKYHAAEKYGYLRREILPVCRPQGLRAPARGYEYHRWACTWVTLYDNCWGGFIISGAHGKNWYRAQVWRGINC